MKNLSKGFIEGCYKEEEIEGPKISLLKEAIRYIIKKYNKRR